MNSPRPSIAARLPRLLFNLLAFLASACGNVVLAQGAWLPPNADYSYPRTLIKLHEVPATQAWIARPDIYPLYQGLYNSGMSFVPGTFQDNGSRRAASFAAKNLAFAFLLDRRPNGGNLDTLTDAQALFIRDKAINLLNLMNTSVEAYPDFENYLWRSNELTNNLIAYDLLKGAGVPDSLLGTARTKLQEYAGNLHQEITFDFLNLGLFSLHVDNHSLRSCGAVGLAAVVLNDATSSNAQDRPANWINTALFQIDQVFFRDPANAQSIPGVLAGYAEGPHYLRFGMKHVFPFIHALSNFIPDTTLSVTYDGSTRSIRHPWHDPDHHRLYEWVMRIRMPDGRFPAIEDGFSDVAYPELAITERPGLHAPIHFSRWEPEQINTLVGQLHHSTDDVVADYIAARTEAQPDTFSHFQALPDAGSLVFRNRWDSTANYWHFTARHGLMRTSAKGHNQADVSSFILAGHGQVLALDAGYLRWDRRGEVADADNHNMILVDGAGPPTGQTSNPGDADGFIEDAYDLPRMDYAEVRTSYLGANITRRPIHMREDYFILADQVESGNSHSYRWQLHGFGIQGGDSLHGQFVLDSPAQTATWTKNGVNLRATVVTGNAASTMAAATATHELAYDTAMLHSVLHVDQAGTSARYLAVLMPHLPQDSPMVAPICGSGCGAIRIERPGYLDIATVQASTPAAATGLADDLLLDGAFGLYSDAIGLQRDQILIGGGRFLALGADTLIWSSVRNDIAFARVDSVRAEGFATTAATVKLRVDEFVPGTVLGAAVQAWSYNPGSQVLTVQFGGGGQFQVLEEVIIGTAGGQGEGRLRVWPNPARERIMVSMDAGREAAGGRLEWWDAMGRRLRVWDLAVGEASRELNVSGMASGWGWLRWVDGEGAMMGVQAVFLE